jgi:integrase
MHNYSTLSNISASAWLNYYDVRRATGAVMAHLASLPSAATPEKHTERAYTHGLRAFLGYIGDAQPSADVVQAFIAHLMGNGLKASTIASKYLAPVRLFIQALLAQRPAVPLAERLYLDDMRASLEDALKVKSPKPSTISNLAPLWRAEFKRLSLKEVQATLRQIDRSTLAGMRDYAMLHVAFSTGLRIAELARITPINIAREGDLALITVRGKRGNVDPVPISTSAYADVLAWIKAYNAVVPATHQILGDTPIWQPLAKAGKTALKRLDPCKGISHQALRSIIANRTQGALGADRRISAHDTRRTAAAIAYDSGMGIAEIQALLRHKNAAVTLHYVGTKPDHASHALGLRVSFA